jgi:hypothetical protein
MGVAATIGPIAIKKEGPEVKLPSPGSHVGWTIFGKFSVFGMGVDASCTSAGGEDWTRSSETAGRRPS